MLSSWSGCSGLGCLIDRWSSRRFACRITLPTSSSTPQPVTTFAPSCSPLCVAPAPAAWSRVSAASPEPEIATPAPARPPCWKCDKRTLRCFATERRTSASAENGRRHVTGNDPRTRKLRHNVAVAICDKWYSGYQ